MAGKSPVQNLDQAQVTYIIHQVIREIPDKLFATCPDCRGTGKVDSEKWAKWWETHEADWQVAIKDKDGVPNEPEKLECKKCSDGVTVTNLGIALGKVVEKLQLIRNKAGKP